MKRALTITGLVALCLFCMAPLVPDVRTVTTEFSRRWLRCATSAAMWDALGAADSLTLTNGIVAADSATNRFLDLTAATNIFEDIIFSVTTLNPPGAATPATLSSTSGQSGNQLALVFNNGDMMMVAYQMPHTWQAGSTVYPHLHIEPQTTNSITSTWRVAYSVADIGGAFPADTVVTQTVTVAGSNQWVHRLVNLPTNGISMAGKSGPSTVGKLHYECLTTDRDIHLVSFDVHYRWGGSPVVFAP